MIKIISNQTRDLFLLANHLNGVSHFHWKWGWPFSPVRTKGRNKKSRGHQDILTPFLPPKEAMSDSEKEPETAAAPDKKIIGII